MKVTALLGKGLVATGVVAAGLSSGSWVNHTVHRSYTPAQPAPDTGLAEGELAPATPDSLLHYQFTPGERLLYSLGADISGAGMSSAVLIRRRS